MFDLQCLVLTLSLHFFMTFYPFSIGKFYSLFLSAFSNSFFFYLSLLSIIPPSLSP